MKVGDIVNLDINYSITSIPKLELAIIRRINIHYNPTRYYLTVVATGAKKWATSHYIYPLEAK